MSILRKVSVVLRGTLVAQAIGIVFLPIITRLFSVEAFGQYQLYQSVLAVLLVLTTMRYEIAILRVRTRREVDAVIRLTLLLTLFWAVVAAGAIGLVQFFHLSATVDAWSFGAVAIAAGMLIGGPLQMLYYIILRHEAYGKGVWIRIVQASTFVGASLGLGLARAPLIGLVLSDLGSKFAATALFVRNAQHHGYRLLGHVRMREVATVARRHKDYPIYSMPGGLISAMTISLPPMMMFAFFGAATVGQYGLVERTMTMPLNLVAISLTQAYTGHLTSQMRGAREGMTRDFFRATAVLGALGAIPLIILAFFGRELVTFVFGAQWGMAGEFARIMAPFYLISFMMSPGAMVLLTFGKQKTHFAWELLRFGFILTVWYGIRAFGYDAYWAVGLNAAVHVVFGVVFIRLVHRELRSYEAAAIRGQGQS